jgi:hypothetical protein
MLREEPADVFLRYSLALELNKEGRSDESIRYLRELMTETPPHVPAFFMAGQQLAGIGRVEEARAVLRDGIGHARDQGDTHAAGEMSEFLAGLGSRGESFS